MQKTKLLFDYVLLITAILSSCSYKDETSQSTSIKYERDSTIYYRKIDVTDSLLYATIKDYIKAYEVNPKETMIGVELYGNGEREVVFIDQRFYRLEVADRSPSFFADINGHVVLFYSDIGKYIDGSAVKNEIDRYTRALDINLKTYFNRVYHPPLWKYVRCSDSFRIQKENVPLVMDYLPCGVVVEQDSSQIGYKIVKEE